MKKILATIAIALASASAFGAEKPDTLAVAATADSILIREHDNDLSVVIYGIDGDSTVVQSVSQNSNGNRVVTTRRIRQTKLDAWADRHFHRTPRTGSQSPWQYIIGGVNFGFNTALDAPAGMEVQMGKSLNIGMLYASGASYTVPGTNNSFNMGLGIDWRTWRMDYPSGCFIPSADGGVGLGQFPEGVNPVYSRLRTFSLTMPLLWRQQLPLNLPRCGKMSLLLGPIVDFNVHGSMLNRWTDPRGNEVEQSTNSIGQRKITVEAFGALYVNSWLGFYVRYSPMKVLNTPSPQFRNLSTGIICSF